MKPLKGNNCETCPKRWYCLTDGQGTVCPILCGEDVEKVLPMQRCNIAIMAYEHGLYRDGYRIKPDELIKLLRKAKFRVHTKYGCNYLEVIE